MPSGYDLVTSGPAFAPLRYGLLSTAQEIPATGAAWRRGTRWVPDPCGELESLAVACVSGVANDLAPTLTGVGSVAADGFAVYSWIDCGPAGMSLDEVLALGTRHLTRHEGRAVEQVVWTGDTATGVVYPHLASDTEVLDVAQGASQSVRQLAAEEVTTAAVDVVEAVGELEGYLGSCYGGEGVLHVPSGGVARLAEHNLVSRDGGMLRTVQGHRVAVYAGDYRTGPDGSAAPAGDAWFYATGAVGYRRSDVQSFGETGGEIVGREKNDVLYLVGRFYQVVWDCCLGAAQVDLSEDA